MLVADNGNRACSGLVVQLRFLFHSVCTLYSEWGHARIWHLYVLRWCFPFAPICTDLHLNFQVFAHRTMPVGVQHHCEWHKRSNVVSELHRAHVVRLIESDRNKFMSFIARADNKTMQNSDNMAGQWVNATWNAKKKSQNLSLTSENPKSKCEKNKLFWANPPAEMTTHTQIQTLCVQWPMSSTVSNHP